MGGFMGPGGENERLSSSWLRHVPVWEIGLTVLDEPGRGGAPPRAMLVVMGEGSLVRRELPDASGVEDPDAAARLLAEAVHAVAAEAKGYPRTLLVPEWVTAAHLSAELDRHGVEVRVSPSLREVHTP